MRASIWLAAGVCALLGASAGGAYGQVNLPRATEQFVLSGVILFEKEGGLAWLQEPSLTGDRAVLVRVSESIGPYRVTKILEDRVELQGPAGTVLVPIYHAQGGGRVTVAQVAPGAAGPGPGNPRAGRGGDLGAEAPARPTAQPLQGGASAMQILRDRLEAARRQADQAPRNPRTVETQSAGKQGKSGVSTTTSGTAGGDPTSGSGAGASASGSAAPTGDSSAASSNPQAPADGSNVVYPTRRQTFQSILGLQ